MKCRTIARTIFCPSDIATRVVVGKKSGGENAGGIAATKAIRIRRCKKEEGRRRKMIA
jgi:hypothetical protein